MRLTVSLRLILPSLWLGLVIALSFIEAPLKFQAPGITVPLGLGIGRLMFFALAIGGWVLLIALTITALRPPRPARADVVVLAGLWVVLAVQTFVIRPPLNARSDIVIAGGDPGDSPLHYLYIASDVLIVALLVVWLVRAVRALPVR
ncbi:hypothetical protein [Microbacterium sp. No. 7]|uniref:hypothetical protein n=1 Tax=Microbacterium sp. No. 7 TaxID=1714373 RepID=UPI0006CF2D6A|nr:hypothetical protein [Microbacterium sp. No. 7]ALJ21089.1 hypothetical protein AOA12_14735 [Microbacterium sp. No. 7]